MKRISIGDFPIGKEERDAINRVLDSSRISEHREVRAFEEEFADWLGVKYAIAMNSGTSALMCGLRASRYTMTIDRILIPALTFIATANAARLVGLEVIFGDILPHNFGLNPSHIKPGVQAVMPVHLFGYTCNMHDIHYSMRMNLDSDAVLIEDSCEAHGSIYSECVYPKIKCGVCGWWSAFSFYIAHTVQAGEMGVVATDDPEVRRLCVQLKAHGRECSCIRCTRPEGTCPLLTDDHDPRYHHVMPGYNFKAMEFQAALARLQLSRIDENIECRRENVYELNRLLRDCGELKLPPETSGVAHMMYPLVLPFKSGRMVRYLERRGVEARPMFGCIPTQQPAYAYLKKQYEGKLPVAELYGSNGILVGCHQYLDKSDMKVIANTILDGMKYVER